MRIFSPFVTLVLVGFGATWGVAQDQAPRKDIDPATVAACGKLGLKYGGWITSKAGVLNFQVRSITAHEGRPGFLAPPRFDAKNKLPEIAVPFGLVYPYLDDQLLMDLAAVKNLNTLQFGLGKQKLNLKELANFRDLSLLVLYNEQITDDVVADLCAVKLLHILTRAWAEDGGRPKSEKEIATLDLRKTQVTAQGIAQLGNLTSLATLHLTPELLTDGVLAALAKFDKLHSLPESLAKDGTRPKNAAEVVRLDLRSGRIAGAGLKELASLKNLTQIDLAQGQVTDAALAGLRHIQRRNALLQAKTRTYGRPASEDEIEVLFLKGTSLSPAGLKELTGLKNVFEVVVDNSRVTDEALRSLRAAGLLFALYGEVRPSRPKAPLAPEKVETFSLYGTTITDAGLKELAEFKNLRRLILSDTKITDAGLKELRGFEQLVELQLARTPLTDAAVQELTGLKNMRTLNLQGTRLTKKGVDQLRAALPQCNVFATAELRNMK